MNEKFLKPYNPAETEDRIYKVWEESGFFNPDNLPDAHKEPYSIILPPPNATGTLHVGGALMTVIEDIIIRYKRQNGYKTLWLPGTDHAAIATNSKVEKILQKEEGKSRHDLGREEFIKKVESFVEETRGTIKHQIKKMGASLDWSREAFTLDDKRNLAVRTAFKEMYEAGLIYRGTRVINWDPKGQTTISDDEIVYQERDAVLYTFKYSKDFPISISTTRPETKLGDTAVAVHPDDARYKEFVGKTYNANFAGANLSIKVVADESVDPEFGTGALGVTPAHSQIDAEIAKRHKLESIQVINEFAKISLPIEGLQNEKVVAAREKIVEWLRTEGLLEKEGNIKQNVSTAERTGGIIEPLPKLQWFVDVNKSIEKRGGKSLKELMQESVSSGAIEILPERFEKVYYHWIENLHDWNISRQIWYGHRIPAWYKGSEVFVGTDAPVGDGWTQDEDTLDTWFSSGLWTFSTLGWPDETNDLKTFHPTDLLETGYDILFFWVARMILMSQFFMGEVPFKTVYLHGLVRNAKGEKISKSLGGNVDPLEIIGKYGTDALRMALVVGVGPGADSRLSDDKLKAYKNFANKVWNISRFILENTEGASDGAVELESSDKDFLNEFEEFKKDITKDLDEYRLHLAAEKLYHYIWHKLADVIIEDAKKKIKEGNENGKASSQWLLKKILNDCLILLHPFMPFITEEIWQTMGKQKLLMIEEWPK
jgi:valyl-tRNA synthetase